MLIPRGILHHDSDCLVLVRGEGLLRWQWRAGYDDVVVLDTTERREDVLLCLLFSRYLCR